MIVDTRSSWHHRSVSHEHHPEPTYAIVDLETTGLEAPEHRIVECAVLQTDTRGEVLREWSTLVAIPGEGEIGADWLHGITRPMLVRAPTFPEIAAELVAQLIDRVVVGHVLDFDLLHLQAEFARMEVQLPQLRRSGICTRDLARMHLCLESHSLASCCTAANVTFTRPHTALGDAHATAGLLRYFIARRLLEDREVHDEMATLHWPHLAFASAHLSRRIPA